MNELLKVSGCLVAETIVRNPPLIGQSALLSWLCSLRLVTGIWMTNPLEGS